ATISRAVSSDGALSVAFVMAMILMSGEGEVTARGGPGKKAALPLGGFWKNERALAVSAGTPDRKAAGRWAARHRIPSDYSKPASL
ncbi:MAG: hypothetical protein PHF66_07010, partial [Desulfobacteraceae bacterium]|nr:hypothetical protein [Desulfobacteraceae bacterium]